jgi:TnpA family transposase
MVAKAPRLLTAEQRDACVRIPADLSDRDLGRFYTLSARDLQLINRHRRPANRLGFAVQLALLRFPGRTRADGPEVPARVVEYIAPSCSFASDVLFVDANDLPAVAQVCTVADARAARP